jgi:hypothetical protein
MTTPFEINAYRNGERCSERSLQRIWHFLQLPVAPRLLTSAATGRIYGGVPHAATTAPQPMKIVAQTALSAVCGFSSPNCPKAGSCEKMVLRRERTPFRSSLNGQAI